MFCYNWQEESVFEVFKQNNHREFGKKQCYRTHIKGYLSLIGLLKHINIDAMIHQIYIRHTSAFGLRVLE